MATLELWVHINATPEQVWDVIADLETQQRWMVDLRSLDFTTESRSGAGTEVDVVSELFGLPLVKDKMRITSWQPPFRYDVAHVGQFTGTGAFVLQPAAGGTLFTWREHFKPPLGPLGELGFMLIVGPHLRRVFTRSMENVKHLAEARDHETS